MKRLIAVLCACLFTGCGLFWPDLFSDPEVLVSDKLSGVLFINEVSASNPDAIDWVELYNSHERALSLKGFYLSDDSSYLKKWKLPAEMVIGGRSYLIITCGSSGAGMDANFSIAADDEQVCLTAPDGTTELDNTDGEVPNTGTGSWARTSDGGGSWATDTTPTRGGPNS